MSSYPNALCLKFSSPNKDIYIAAGNYEEMCKWRDVLMFHCSRHRNSKSFHHHHRLHHHHKHQKSNTESNNNNNNNKTLHSSNKSISKKSKSTNRHNTLNDVDDDEEDLVELNGEDLDDEEINLDEEFNNANNDYYGDDLLGDDEEDELVIDQKNVELSPSSQNKTNESNANENTNTNSVNSDESRRLSYKEDDMIRKQRLKENLNQLLIEYKHEEEAQLKKYSKFASNSNINPPANSSSLKQQNRTSLDSCYKLNNNSTSTNKNSAFSLVQNNHSSSFRPISLPNKTISNKSATKSSWSSSSSSSNSPPKTRSRESSTHTITNTSPSAPVPNDSSSTSTAELTISSHSQIYKKPCLISPRKSGQQANNNNSNNNCNNNNNNNNNTNTNNNDQDDSSSYQLANSNSSLNVPNNNINSMSSSTTSTSSTLSTSSNKSLTIQVRNSVDESGFLSDYNKKPKDTTDNSKNEFIDLTTKKNSITNNCSNVSGYLLKSKDNSETLLLNEKYWFSLNTNSCNLLYWNDKYEQDLGKFPLGKYELSKCSQLIKDIQSTTINHYEDNSSSDLAFKITFHQNSSFILLTASNKENKLSWCESIKYTIDHISSNCTKCKPKLVVNPMQSLNNNNSLNSPNNQSSQINDDQSLIIVNNSNSSSKKCTKQASKGIRSPISPASRQANSLMSSIQASKLKSLENNNLGNSEQTSSTTSLSSSISYDSLKQKYDKLSQDNTELQSKFKLLEQIHLNTINEYEKRQNRLYNQIDEMHVKLSTSELDVEQLNKKLTQSNKSNDSSLMQLQNLNDHLNKYKETMQLQEREIEKLNKKLQQINASENLNQINDILVKCETKMSPESNNKLRGWNKEVKNLDSRINDLLAKIKEREMNLAQISKASTSTQTITLICDDESYKSKCDQLEFQLQEAQNKINQLQTNNSRTSLTKPAINLNDFSDDLGKVLMSKEEVITSLEKQLKDREKQVQALTSQLNEEIFQSNKYQDAFNLELNRNTQLNNEIKSLNECLNQQYCFNTELDSLKQDLSKANSFIKKLEFDLTQSNEQREKIEIEFKNLQEDSKNEFEILQEEIKTFEYKLVHSQRQAQEYQSILEDMDLSNTNSINFLSQTLTLCGGSPSSLGAMNDSSLQNRLKRTQSFVQLLIQQIIQIKNSNIEDLSAKLQQLQNEFEEVKEENIDLNDHIYSVDVYMREKESQCDEYQKEKDELLEKLQDLTHKLAKLDRNCSENANNQAKNIDYDLFLDRLRQNLNSKTNNLNDFIKFILSLCNYFLIKLDSNNTSKTLNDDMIISECGILEHVSQLNINTTCNIIDINTFKQILIDKLILSNEMTTNLNDMKKALKNLVKFINSSGLTKFNNQILSYMAEQLIHKAALNGHLKFACELLRKKSDQSENNSNNPTLKSEQDEKIFKLASELLLSDEDSLRKLSAQLLNEAQHLNQLNCVLNSLNKLRFKNLSFTQNKKLLGEFFKNLDIPDMDQQPEDVDDELNKLIGDLNNEIYYQDPSCRDEKLQNTQLNYILDVIKNIFVEHKEQISQQLNEVHKLMSISSDDDLLAHLQ